MSDIGLGSWPARRARIAPHRVALRDEDRSLTYAELADRVDRLAGGLALLGVRAGDRVAYLGPNALATFEALFATCRLGAVFVPLNTRLATPELARLLADAGRHPLHQRHHRPTQRRRTHPRQPHLQHHQPTRPHRRAASGKVRKAELRALLSTEDT